ncbi:hypothetical protein CFS9_25980 [Flavobacterium sp. CFS9]|uniref:SH3 domain-containing protein n=1 Tax=Flavobacterium sp. CFS9 TaxID=3143118 RepID=A0AAT9H361_9FLAO
MKKISLILLLFILNSCASNYYFVNVDEDTPIFTSKNGKESVTIIPKGSGAYITRSDKKARKIKWKNFKGWAINPLYSNPIFSNPTLSANSSNNNSTDNNYTKSSIRTSSGGSVQVKGYTRKNGTYVAPHTRSAPRRR